MTPDTGKCGDGNPVFAHAAVHPTAHAAGIAGSDAPGRPGGRERQQNEALGIDPWMVA